MTERDDVSGATSLALYPSILPAYWIALTQKILENSNNAPSGMHVQSPVMVSLPLPLALCLLPRSGVLVSPLASRILAFRRVLCDVMTSYSRGSIVAVITLNLLLRAC